MTVNDVIFEFFEQVDEIFGMYLDATMALKLMGVKINEMQVESSKELNFSIDYLDTLPHIYGEGDPNDPNSIILHESTQGEYKIRIKEGGRNHVVISHLCITQTYQYWEDHYRSLIAQTIGRSKQDIKSDVFGDLRIYRNSIIHHRAIALPEINKCKVFKWHSEGDEIKFTDKQIQEIIINVKTEINSLPEKYYT